MQLRVTNIVGEIYFPDLYVWKMDIIKTGSDPEEVVRRAAELGTLGHECVENKCLVEGAEKQLNLVLMYKHLKQFIKDYDPIYEEVEVEVDYRGEEGVFRGHIDLLAEINGDMWLIDTKTHGLYKEFEVHKTFTTLSAAKKAKVNLQTWLYQLAGNGKYDKYKRGVLHINQYGYELIELKRKPSKEVMAEAMNIVTRHKNATIF